MNLLTKRMILLKLVLFCICSIILFASTPDEWLIVRGDPQLTGVAQTTLPAEIEPLWVFQAGDSIESAAAIYQDRVFVTSLDAHLYALDLQTGEQLWKYQTDGEIKSSPSIAKGIIYFGNEAGEFHAVDAVTGEQQIGRRRVGKECRSRWSPYH